MTADKSRLLSPEEIAVQAGQEPTFLHLPNAESVYAERELRLRLLASNHAMRDYLLFAAELCHAQQAAARESTPPVPPIEVFERAAAISAAPLPATSWQRDPSWCSDLRAVLQHLAPRVEGTARQVVDRLAAADDALYNEQADRILGGLAVGLDLATAPLIAAGLQVHWSSLVAASQKAYADMPGGAFGRIADATACPCCASRPTASVIRLASDVAGQRYLHCSLCSTQWYMVRIKCAHCESTKGITYEQLELAAREGKPEPAAVRAECCAECGHYLKIVAMDKDPHVEPVADDLATLSLDLLVSESGPMRHGVNMLLYFGDAED